MNPRRFRGKDMSEALRSVRSALGPDALIVETQNLPQEAGGGVQITALCQGPVAEEPGEVEFETTVQTKANPVDELRQELATLKSMLCWLAPGLSQPDKIFSALLKHGLAPEALTSITEAMKKATGADDRERLYRAIRGLIPSGGQIRGDGDRLALIGPTGMGKTTAVIKLTVFENHRRNCRVGWINTDQRRLATGDLLGVYAGILGIPYEKAENRKELKQAFDRLSACDLVLVDTPGINARNDKEVKELAKLLHGFPDLRRTLLMSAVTNGNDMADWVAIYRRVGLDSLFFTKMDECRYLGPVFNTALGSGVPLSYLTLGQNFAGDLEIARPEVFASLLLTGDDSND
jgi:flagellar biosynthesis protein FlhF